VNFSYQKSTMALFTSRTAKEADATQEWEMLYMSNARVSRRARRWAYANRPYESIDNPVKRYLGNKLPVSKRSRVTRFRRALGSGKLRPAF
jgi:hypothetical protein